MATRATYQIDPEHVFYCHWDGYPAGAALRFARMIEAMTRPATEDRPLHEIEERRGGFPAAFIRGNLDAEFTEGHEAHADTEWRYILEVQRGSGAATVRSQFRTGSGEWATDDLDPLEVFVNDHREIGNGPLMGIPLIVSVVEKRPCMPDLVRYATEENAARIAETAYDIAMRFDEENPNREELLDRAIMWAQAAGLCSLLGEATRARAECDHAFLRAETRRKVEAQALTDALTAQAARYD